MKTSEQKFRTFMDYIQKNENASGGRYFLTNRYFRRNAGALTACCLVFPKKNKKYKLIIGMSLCSPDEKNFSRKEGKEFALRRMIESPIILDDVPNIAPAIIDYLKQACPTTNAIREKLGLTSYGHDDKSGNLDVWYPKFVKEL